MSRYFRFLIFFVFIFCSSVALSDTDKFSADFFNPAVGPNTFFILHDTKALHQFQFRLGTYASTAYRPLELTNQTTGSRLQGIIDHLAKVDIMASFGITDWMQLGVDMPLFIANYYQSPDVVPGPGISHHFDLGDFRASMKIRAFDPCCSVVGLAFVPFITAPTGNSNHYVGDEGVTGGGRVVLEVLPLKSLHLVANAGYVGGKQVRFNNVEYQHRLLYGAGLAYDVIRDLSVLAEINGEASNNHFFTRKAVTPVEAMGGVRWNVARSGFELSAAAGSCLVCGVRSARFRGIVGLNYSLATPKHKKLDDEAYDRCLIAPVAQEVSLPESGRVALVGNELNTYMPVRFAFNSVNLKGESRSMVSDVVKFINSNKSIKRVIVEGHADSIGPLVVNKRISIRRAHVVISNMKGLGIRSDVVLQSVGHGYTKPEVPNTTAQNRARNRRVVFTISS